jgi:rhodanese-related sulfurtransferase
MLEAGNTPLIFDLRSNAAVQEDPALIQGAVHISVEDIESRLSEFPKDRDIVVYCSCPNEVSSARLALRLQRKGFTRVRPLLGGLDGWREQNFPTDVRIASVSPGSLIAAVSCDMKLHSVLLGGAILTKPCVCPQVLHGSMRLAGCPEVGAADRGMKPSR